MAQKLKFVCGDCEYTFSRANDYQGPCPYCSSANLDTAEPDGANNLIKDSVLFSDE